MQDPKDVLRHSVNVDPEPTPAAVIVPLASLATAHEAVRAEREQLRAILDQLPAGTVLVGADGLTVEFVSATAREVLGGDGKLSALTNPTLVLRGVDGHELPLGERPVARALAGDPVRLFECELESIAGYPRRLRVNATQMRDADGAVVGALVAFTEITSEREALEESRRNEEFRDLFLGMLGHDLRNPLAAILTSARLALRRGALPLGEQKTITRIVSSGERMERMIDQILDMTRARQKGGIPLRRGPKDVSLSVVKAVEEARAGHADAVLEVEIAPDGRLVASIDADRIEQVLSNLIGNAIVHSPPGRPVRITVGSDVAFVVVTVHNEGPPIPDELQRTLFDPFTRGHSPKQERSRGLGLGLYIADHIVRAHGGAIALESTFAGGTTFAFTMPRASAGDKDAYVLVVEDDQDLRETTQEVLEVAGFNTVSAQDGAQALRVLAERGLPNLIFLDLVMPVMDGWAFLSKLRAEPVYALVPVIVTTSVTSRAPAGVLVLKKPVTPESLEQHARR